MYQLREKNLADIVAIYGRGRELFRPPTYTIAVCTVKKLLMVDRGTVRNVWSFIPRINLRN